MDITFRSVSKSFTGVRAVDEISCTFAEGAIHGLVGPNGAGKTTMIRMMLDILRPDEGEILVDGHPLDDAGKDRIGYLPEERGLYKKQKVHEILEYFAMLKGLSFLHAKERAAYYLERLGMDKDAGKKLDELSKGNQQKIQIASALVADPEFVVLDEPFSGLDPVNQLFMKDFLKELRTQGRTVVFSTHQMHQVEELCEEVFMINKGKAVLDGSLRDVKKKFSDHSIRLRLGDGQIFPAELPMVKRSELRQNGFWRVFLQPPAEPSGLLHALLDAGCNVEFFEMPEPSLEEIFIKIAQSPKGQEGEVGVS